MRRALIAVLMLVLTASASAAPDPVSILDNHRQLDLYVTVPQGVREIGVAVECEHVYKSGIRVVAARQEHFRFVELHADEYTIEVVFLTRGGKEQRLVRTAFVSD